MTEVVSVSAVTAAYATEGLKPSARVSGSPHTHEATFQQTQEARAADNLRHAQMMNVVGPPAIAVFFLTAGERNRLLQQTTLREAEDAYFFGREEVEETSDKQSDEEASEENASEDGDDEEEFHEEQTEVLALPAPADHFS